MRNPGNCSGILSRRLRANRDTVAPLTPTVVAQAPPCPAIGRSPITNLAHTLLLQCQPVRNLFNAIRNRPPPRVPRRRPAPKRSRVRASGKRNPPTTVVADLRVCVWAQNRSRGELYRPMLDARPLPSAVRSKPPIFFRGAHFTQIYPIFLSNFAQNPTPPPSPQPLMTTAGR